MGNSRTCRRGVTRTGRLAVVAGAMFAALAGPASAPAELLHAVGMDPNTLYTIDSVTGDYAVVGDYALTEPANEIALGGLEFGPDGTLYGMSLSIGARLYRVDPTNGAATEIGRANRVMFEGGLAADPTTGAMFGAAAGSLSMPILVRFDMNTGATSVVGVIRGGAHDFDGLAFDAAGRLYGIDRITNALWAIDKTDPSGAGTAQVGAGFGGSVVLGDVGGMTFDPRTGLVYGYAQSTRTLFTIDLGAGSATPVRTYSVEDPDFLGLAAIPEPAMAMPALLCGMVLLRRRRCRRG